MPSDSGALQGAGARRAAMQAAAPTGAVRHVLGHRSTLRSPHRWSCRPGASAFPPNRLLPPPLCGPFRCRRWRRHAPSAGGTWSRRRCHRRLPRVRLRWPLLRGEPAPLWRGCCCRRILSPRSCRRRRGRRQERRQGRPPAAAAATAWACQRGRHRIRQPRGCGRSAVSGGCPSANRRRRCAFERLNAWLLDLRRLASAPAAAAAPRREGPCRGAARDGGRPGGAMGA
mmetsp:Transcript_97993/g.282662  ORF Transcript_97993/g.282662 Transcript_97993/m.282662 type:complete len:228 (-) Transcript_97993:1214-1897(-)